MFRKRGFVVKITQAIPQNKGVTPMALQVFVNFDGHCREAVAYYAKVFKTAAPRFMTYGEAPADPEMGVSEKDMNLVMFTDLDILGTNVMFCDTPPGMPFVKGNNISLTVVTKDADEIKRLFHALAAGGEIVMELQETFWSNLYGMVTDRYGIHWQFSHDSGKEVGSGTPQ